MAIDDVTLTGADVAWLVSMSDSWVRDRMQAGEMPRPGATAHEYVETFVAIRTRKYEQDRAASGELDKEQEQPRLAKEQADAKAMDNAERRRELASQHAHANGRQRQQAAGQLGLWPSRRPVDRQLHVEQPRQIGDRWLLRAAGRRLQRVAHVGGDRICRDQVLSRYDRAPFFVTRR